MSIFPKKTILGGKVMLHTSMQYKGNSRSVLVKSKVIDPQNNIKELFTKEYFYFPKNKNNYSSETSLDYCKGHSGLIYANFLKEALNQNNNLPTILERLNLATHDYFQINIDDSFLLGKYQVRSEFVVDGISFHSTTEQSDFFLVEQLSFRQEKEKTIIINESPEPASYRIIFYTNNEEKELVSKIDGQATIVLPLEIDINDAFLMYAEDQKIIPLFEGKTVYRNPLVKFLSEKNSTIVNLNDESCYKLEGELHSLWDYLNGFKSKKNLLKKFSINKYDELFKNSLICEAEL